MTRLRKSLLILLALSLVRVPLAWLKELLLPEPAAAPMMNHAVMMLQALLLFALPGWLLRSEQLRIPTTPAYPVGWGFWPMLLAMLARLTAAPLNRWWAALLDAPISVLPAPDEGLGTAVWVLAAVIVPAVSEELFFRGALLGNLLESGSHRKAILLTTAMFALMHGSPAGLPGHLIIGLTLSALMLHTGRIIEPIAAHMCYNLLVLIRWEAEGIVPWISGLLLLGAICWMLKGGIRRTRQMRLPMPECLISAVILLAMGIQYMI